MNSFFHNKYLNSFLAWSLLLVIYHSVLADILIPAVAVVHTEMLSNVNTSILLTSLCDKQILGCLMIMFCIELNPEQLYKMAGNQKRLLHWSRDHVTIRQIKPGGHNSYFYDK